MFAITTLLLLLAWNCCATAYNATSEKLLSADINNFRFITTKLYSDIKDFARLYRVQSARDSKLTRVSVPLIAGFKFTGLVISAFTAIKIFLLQSLLISKLALTVSLIVVAKVVFDNMKKSSFKFPEVETKVLDYYPYRNSYMDYQELPGVGLDYTKYQNQGQEDIQSLHSSNVLSFVPSLNTTNILARRTPEGLIQNEHDMPVVIGYKTHIKRIIKEVVN